MTQRVQFLLRENHTSGGYDDNYNGIKAGLFNSATFVARALNNYGIETDLRICFDANLIDKEVTRFKPTHCVLEALWVPPYKIRQLIKLHPTVIFVIRIHSKITFLSNEGMAIEWIKEYADISKTNSNVVLTFNEQSTAEDFNDIGIVSEYLPNIYDKVEVMHIPYLKKFKIYLDYIRNNNRKLNYPFPFLDIGCFGSIRPLKNQLLQAFAALEYATKTNTILSFHINAPRLEQGGEAVLKNIKALFVGTPHFLVEHPWLEHDEFLELASTMDIGLQLSLTESFNIITADFVSEAVPIIVSNEIKWMPSIARVDPLNTSAIIKAIDAALNNQLLFQSEGLEKLDAYNSIANSVWLNFLKK